MRKKTSGGGFPVEAIGRAIMNSRPVKALGEKLRKYYRRSEVERLRTSCKVLMVCLVISNCMVLIVSSQRRAELDYANMRQVTTAGMERRPPPVKAFGPVWDSLMADPTVKKGWDSLVRLRPGLRDTVRQLQRMDSASGR